MSDSVRTAAIDAGAIDGEAPVNPYSLLESVNTSSDMAHTAWLILIAVMSYLLIAVAGVTHKDLLLSSEIQLPVLQVKIDLTRFFLFAPFALVLVHLGVVSQLVMLARKALEFDGAIRVLEVSDKRSHPLRLELHNFFFVQAIAGPERSSVMSAFLHTMGWLTLAVLPVVLLLYTQIIFLPFHDAGITWGHRLALVFDVALLGLIGIFLTRPESSFVGAFRQMTRAHPISFAATTAIMIVVMAFSFFVATIPGEPLDRMSRGLPKAHAVNALATEQSSFGFVVPFLGGRADGTLFGIFERNLNATDLDLVNDKDVTPGQRTLILRGRDLRYARLDRTDLHQADLTGANLDGATLVGADLRGVHMQCADINAYILSEDRQAARCPSAQRVNFTRARLKNARMAGVDLRGAKFEDADLEGAELSYALLAGAGFYGAHLERADLTGGVSLIGANFATASLQGADLTGAKLHGADFTSAGLQGAVFAHTALYSASLRDADLEGADFYKARLYGADLKGARIRAATFREAMIWQTVPPEREASELADLSDMLVRTMDEADVAALDEFLKGNGPGRLDGRLRDGLGALVAAANGKAWSTSSDLGIWSNLAVASAKGMQENFKTRLTDHLGKLACKARWSTGSVATGLAKRAQGIEFKGDASALYDRLKVSDCPSATTMSQRALRSLAAAVDSQQASSPQPISSVATGNTSRPLAGSDSGTGAGGSAPAGSAN